MDIDFIERLFRLALDAFLSRHFNSKCGQIKIQFSKADLKAQENRLKISANSKIIVQKYRERCIWIT